jgi:hypothetical protein
MLVCYESILAGESSAFCWGIPRLETRETSGTWHLSKGAKGGVPDHAQVSAQRTGANLGHRATVRATSRKAREVAHPAIKVCLLATTDNQALRLFLLEDAVPIDRT